MKQKEDDRNTENQAFEGAAVGENGDPKTEKPGVARTLETFEARKSAEDESGGGSGDGTAPVAVHPITKNSETNQDEGGTEKCPARGKPALEHPENGRDHGRSGEQHANPGIAEQRAHGESGGLGWRIHGGVGGIVDRRRLQRGDLRVADRRQIATR